MNDMVIGIVILIGIAGLVGLLFRRASKPRRDYRTESSDGGGGTLAADHGTVDGGDAAGGGD